MSSCERHLCDFGTMQATADELHITQYRQAGWPTDPCNFWLIEYGSPTMRDNGQYDSGRAWTTITQCAVEAEKVDTMSVLGFKIAPSPQDNYMYNHTFREKMEAILNISNEIPMYFGTVGICGDGGNSLILNSENMDHYMVKWDKEERERKALSLVPYSDEVAMIKGLESLRPDTGDPIRDKATHKRVANLWIVRLPPNNELAYTFSSKVMKFCISRSGAGYKVQSYLLPKIQEQDVLTYSNEFLEACNKHPHWFGPGYGAERTTSSNLYLRYAATRRANSEDEVFPLGRPTAEELEGIVQDEYPSNFALAEALLKLSLDDRIGWAFPNTLPFSNGNFWVVQYDTGATSGIRGFRTIRDGSIYTDTGMGCTLSRKAMQEACRRGFFVQPYEVTTAMRGPLLATEKIRWDLIRDQLLKVPHDFGVPIISEMDNKHWTSKNLLNALFLEPYPTNDFLNIDSHRISGRIYRDGKELKPNFWIFRYGLPTYSIDQLWYDSGHGCTSDPEHADICYARKYPMTSFLFPEDEIQQIVESIENICETTGQEHWLGFFVAHDKEKPLVRTSSNLTRAMDGQLRGF